MRFCLPTGSTPPTASDNLIRVRLEQLLPHPANANILSETQRDALAANISGSGRYPPLIVRTHPTEPECYQILDGVQRDHVIRMLGHAEAVCYLWECDDDEALLLLATLNRLEGADDPLLRAQLLAELAERLPGDSLAELLPEDDRAIEDALALLELGLDVPDLDESFATVPSETTVLSFSVPVGDADALLAAIERRAAELEGRHRRGRALVELCIGGGSR